MRSPRSSSTRPASPSRMRFAAALADKVRAFEPEVVVGLPTLGLTLASGTARSSATAATCRSGPRASSGTARSSRFRSTSITSPEQAKRLYLDPRMLPLIEEQARPARRRRDQQRPVHRAALELARTPAASGPSPSARRCCRRMRGGSSPRSRRRIGRTGSSACSGRRAWADAQPAAGGCRMSRSSNCEPGLGRMAEGGRRWPCGSRAFPGPRLC